jgi:hypothetical protein
MVLPLATALLPIVGLTHLGDERFEWAMVAFTAAIGSVGHARAYWLNHRHVAPPLVFAAGLAIVIAARLSLEKHGIEPWALGLGGFLAAGSHYANLRLCRCCCSVAPASVADASLVKTGGDQP